MKLKKIENVLVYFRKDGKRISEQQELMTVLSQNAAEHSINITEHPDKTEVFDLVIAGGGDGTFLDAARIAFLKGVPIAGINIGHLGFLVEINPDETQMIKNLFSGNFAVKERMMINVKILRGVQTVFCFTALNEAAIHRDLNTEMLCFSIKYNKEELPDYKGDGVIIATPTGSTAYNLSCNGPIIYPSEKTIVINAIAPHALTHRPIVLPADGMVSVIIKECSGKGVITCDGRNSFEIFENDIVIIEKSNESLLVVSNPDRSFFDILSQKLHLGKRM